MTIYLSGPITNIDYEAAEAAFIWGEMLVEKAGHRALNPLKLVDQEPGREYNEYLADALSIMLKHADAVLFMQGWQNSKGCRTEYAVAKEGGI